MTVAPPVCMVCKHLRLKVGVDCDAFPDRIPDKIWLEGDPHTQSVPGDHGIHFEQAEGKLTPEQLRG
jgi:hypothetical protein